MASLSSAFNGRWRPRRHRHERMGKRADAFCVSCIRTDDLFSDATAHEEAKLLLEKRTHIALRIHLDSEQGKLNVNDEPLDILSHQPISVGGIKVEVCLLLQRVKGNLAEASCPAQTISLPVDHDSPVVDADEMLARLNQLSLGIAKIEVKVDSEPVSPSIGIATFAEGEPLPSIEALTVRKVGLWIRITEIEGQELSHTTTLYTPILQLVVTSSGNKINKIATLAIDGKAPLDGHRAMPGPVMGMALPEKEASPQQSGHKHHEHGPRPSGFLGWLAQIFGLRTVGREHGKGVFGNGRNGRRPGCQKWRAKMAAKEGKVFNKDEQDRLATHRPIHENPFSGADDEAPASLNGHKEVKDHMKRPGLAGMGGAPIHERPHHREHHGGHRHGHRHGRCNRFFRDLGLGFVHWFAAIVAIFTHPLTLIGLGALAAGTLTYSLTKRILRRGTQLEEDEQASLFDYDKEKEAGLEEVVVVEESLPKYEDQA